MRILYVTDGFPYPLTSGLLRHYYFMRELSVRHSVTLLSLVERDLSAEDLEALRPFTAERYVFPFQDPPASFAQRAMRRLWGRNPYDWAVARMGETATRLHRKQPFDAVLYSGWRTTAVLDHVAAPVVADLCDSAWVRMRSRLRTLRLGRMPIALLYYAYARHLENHLLRRANRALLASPRDREALGARAAVKTSVVPNGVDLDYWRRRSTSRGLDTIVFTGAMHYRPNVDAALHLVEQIQPAVRREVPEARLLIVGRDPAPALQALARRPGVTVTGFVDDMRPYLEQATVFAAPIRFGAGIQNKLLEALAMELPVVASPIAAEGLRTEAGHAPPVVLAADLDVFARELLAQLRAARADARPVAESRCYVERHFRWQGIGEALERVLESVASGDGRS